VQLGWKCATVDAEGGGTLVSSSTVCPGLSDVKPTVKFRKESTCNPDFTTTREPAEETK